MPSYPPFKHYFQNKQHGVVDATRRADGAQVMENLITAFEAIPGHRGIGTNLVDHGSATAEARVLVYSAAGIGGLIADGDIVTITEISTGRKWQVTVLAAWDTDELRFAPADQVLGSAKSTGYNNGGFHDDLDIRAEKAKPIVGAADLKTTGADKVTGEAIAVSTTDATTLAAQVAQDKARLALIADGSGLLAEVVTIDKIDPAAFKEQAPARNLVKNGGMEYGPGIMSAPAGGGVTALDADPPYGWELYGGASAAIVDDSIVFSGKYSLKFTGANDDDGVVGDIIPEFDVAQYQGRDMVLMARVYAPADNVVKLGILGAAGAAWGTAGGDSGEWIQMSLPFTVGASETILKPLIALAAAGAYSVYVDEVQIVEGTVAFAYHESTWEAESRKTKATGLRNIILNKDFCYWPAGTSEVPAAWDIDALGSTVEDEAVEFVTRGHSAELNLVNGGYFRQFFGLLPAGGSYGNYLLANKYITATAWLKRKTASSVPITVRLFTHGMVAGDVEDTWDIDPSDSEFHRYAFTMLTASDTVSGYIAFENNGGGADVDFYLDCVEVAISPYPLPYEMPDMFRLESHSWALPADPSGTSDMYFSGVKQVWNSGKYMIPIGLYVVQSAASAVGANEYSIAFGAVAAVVASVALGQTKGSGGWAALPPLNTWNITPTTDLKVTLSSYSGFAGATTVLATAVFAVID